MLRLSVLLSVGVHLLILSVTSVYVAQRATPPELPVEKRLQVNVRKQTAPQTASPVKQPDEAPFKTVQKSLTRSSQALSLPSPVLQPRGRATVAAATAFTTMPARVPEKHVPDPQPVQPVTPKPREFVAQARPFPAPIRKKPTPAPMIPKQVAARLPEPQSPLQSVDTPVAVPPPVVVTQTEVAPTDSDWVPTQTETATAPLLSERTGGEAVNGSASRQFDPIAAQRERTLREQYLQEVARKIHAVKRYPRHARKQGWEGTVVLKLRILATGKVDLMTIVAASEYEALNEAALQAITLAQPFPKFYQGLSLPALTVNVPIQFMLD